MNEEKDTRAPQTAEDDSTEVKVEHLETGDKAPEPKAPAETKEEETAEPAVDEKAEPEPEPEIDWEDRFLRLAAEFDNFKKRTARQYSQIIKNAEEQLIVEMTEVLDNLERALDPENRNAKVEEFVKGIDLIYGQFKSVLEKRGLTRMNAIGEPFDPEKHEAVMQIDSEDIPEGHVAGEIAPGYMLGDKVIRHSKVIVSKGPAEPEKKEPEEGQA